MPQRVPRYKAPRVKQYRPFGEQRPNAAARGYCDKKHRAWREAVLIADAFACRMCGRVDESNHADHVAPVSERPDLRYDLSNGQCLCSACHLQKTMRESRANRIEIRKL